MKNHIKTFLMTVILGAHLSASAIGKPKPVDPPASETDLSRLVLGTVTRMGSGCEEVDGALAIVRANRITVSTELGIKKSEGEHLVRGTCNLVVPVVLPKDLLLVIDKMRTGGEAAVESLGAAQINAEIFKAGEQSESSTLTLAASEGSQEFELKKETLVLKSGCGEGFNMRVNLSVIAKGEGKVAVALREMDLAAHLEKCH